MRLFTGDVERGCSGTTPGRKLKEHRFVVFIRDLLKGPYGTMCCRHALRLLSLFIDVECLGKQHQKMNKFVLNTRN